MGMTAESPLVYANSIDVAVIWVEKAKKGHARWVDRCTTRQLWAYKTRKRLKPLTQLVKWSMLLMAFFETPSWCILDEAQCFGEGSRLYLAGAPMIHLAVTNAIGIGFLLYLAAVLYLRRLSLGEAHEVHQWHVFGSVCIGVALLDSFVAIFNKGGIVPGSFKLTRLLRPFIFISLTDYLRKTAARVIRSIPGYVDVMVALALCLFFAVWIGIVLFGQSTGGKEHFPSWQSSFANMWILFTTANNPDAYVQIYLEHRLAFVFFASYLVISLYLLNNLLLSSVYDSYKNQLKDLVESFDECQQTSLDHAFKLLCTKGTEKIDAPTFASFFTRYFKTHGDPKNEKFNKSRAMVVFEALDKDHSNGLDRAEFQLVVDVLQDDTEYIPAGRPPSWAWVKAMERWFSLNVTFHGPVTDLRYTLTWDDLIDFVVFFNVVLAFVKTVLWFDGGRFNDSYMEGNGPWFVILFSFSCFYMVELTLKICVLGFERFWHRNPFMNRFDLVNVYGSVLAEIVCMNFPGLSSVGSRLAVLLHIARSLRLLRHVRQLHFIATMLVRLQDAYWNMFVLLFFVYYIYATIGVQAFGGLIYKGNAALEGSAYVANDYWGFNFNDFPAAMMTIFLLMVVNNWFVFTGAFIRVTGTRFAAFFFVSFFVVTNMITLNVLMALILDCSSTLRAELKEAAEEQQVEERDVTVQPGKYSYVSLIRRALLDHDHHEDQISPRSLLSPTSHGSSGSYYGTV